MIQCPFEIWYHNHKKFMKWCDLINPDDFEPQTLNLIRTSHNLMCDWVIKCTKSRKRLDGDSEVSWRHVMSSNIVYTYIKKDAMLDKLYITMLLNNESLSNRLWWHRKTEFKRIFWTSNEFKSLKNNIFEVLPSRMLFDREIKDSA